MNECGICNSDGSDCAEDILGCTVETACNYNPDATYDDGSCWTATDGCSCDDPEGSIADCAGVCNGSAVEDCAGVCEGTTEFDCAGVCEGTAELDCNGQCNGLSELDPEGNCCEIWAQDCAGVYFGSAIEDCGVCEGTAGLIVPESVKVMQ